MEFSYKITWINKMGELLLLYTLFLERILYQLNMKIDSFLRETPKKMSLFHYYLFLQLFKA